MRSHIHAQPLLGTMSHHVWHMHYVTPCVAHVLCHTMCDTCTMSHHAAPDASASRNTQPPVAQSVAPATPAMLHVVPAVPIRSFFVPAVPARSLFVLLAMMAVGRSLLFCRCWSFCYIVTGRKPRSRGRHQYRCLVALIVLSSVPDVRHDHGLQNCCSCYSACDVTSLLLLRCCC